MNDEAIKAVERALELTEELKEALPAAYSEQVERIEKIREEPREGGSSMAESTEDRDSAE